VRDGLTGFVENPFDVAAFADRVGTLLADPDLRVRMGLAGRERLMERFTIDRLTTEYLEEYEAARSTVRRARSGLVSDGSSGR